MRRFLCVALFIASATGALGGSKTVTKGQFDLYLNGQKKGYEKYKVERNPKDGVAVFSSEMHFQLPMLKTKRNYVDLKLYPALTLGLEKGDFVDYEYRLSFNDFSQKEMVESQNSAREYIDQDQRFLDPMNMTAYRTEDEMNSRVDLGVNAGRLERRGQTLVFRQTKFSATRVKDEQVPSDLVVLDAYSFVLYLPVAQRACSMKGASESFQIAMPQTMKMRPGRIEYMGTEKTPFRLKSYILKHFEVLIENSVLATFWVDREGTLVQISVPGEGVLAVLTKYEPKPFDAEDFRVASRETVITQGGFDERTFTLQSGGVTLAGSFIAPQAKGPHPAVILCQDLGAMDRDGNGDEEALHRASTLKQVAFYLAEQGFSSARWDCRGVGSSGGAQEGNSPEVLTGDIIAVMDWVKAQPDVRKDQVVISGAGLGAWLAAMAAAKTSAAAFVGIAFPAKEILRLWKEQASAVTEPDARQKAYAELETLSAQLKGKDEWGKYRNRKVHLQEYRALAQISPLDVASALQIPTLLAYPERDQVVLAHHREIVSAQLKPNQTAIILPTGNHSLQGVDADGNPKGLFDPKVIDPVVEWLRKVLASGANP